MNQTSAVGSPPNRLATFAKTLETNEPVFQLVEHSPFGMLLADSDHNILYANKAACTVMDTEPEELTNKHLSDILGDTYEKLVSEDYTARPVRQKTRRLGNTGRQIGERIADLFEEGPNEFTIQTFCGMTRIIEIISAGQSANYALWYLNDVSARKQLEVELQYRDTFFHNLIDSSVDGIIAADMRGQIIMFNSGAQKILGYSQRDAFTQLHVSNLYPEGEARRILRRMRSSEYGGKGKLFRHELIAITQDGAQIPMSLSGGIIYDGAKEIATFGIFTDLRAMRKVEEDLEQTHEMLLQSEKMAGLGRLAAGVAHEINNPMSGIMLFSNLVKEQLGDDHAAAGDMNVIINEAERCKQIVADLLEFSHQTSYEQTGVDVEVQIRKALDILLKQPIFHNIKLDLQIEPDLSRIFANPIRLNQVFMNLIVNAAQAMEGVGALTIMAHHRSNQGIVEICFKDSGPGMPKEIQDQIFDPFFTTKTDSGGTGLGLSVSYAIVREHKGTIRVKSEPGQGTTFTLRIPALQREPTEAAI
jgi:two-component system, NtrC family, sensor kinase